MPVSSKAVANAFLDLAREGGKELTNMQVQKLVFLAQGFCLAALDRPLHDEATYAYQWGPVMPKLYEALRQYGRGEVKAPLDAPDAVTDAEALDIIRAVWEGHQGMSGSRLSALTHEAGSPWEKAWKIQRFSVIPNQDIRDFYKQQLAQA